MALYLGTTSTGRRITLPAGYKTLPQTTQNYLSYITQSLTGRRPRMNIRAERDPHISTTQAQTPSGGYTYDVAGIPSISYSYNFGGYKPYTYKLPNVDIPIPNLTWTPTEEQKQAWLSEAQKRAALQIDPQVATIANAVKTFKEEAERQRGVLNPYYDAQSLAIANIIKNTIKQDIIDEAIRRGAETSGELPRQLAEAGKVEVEKRSDIEKERQRVLKDIADQILSQEREAEERKQELERMRGLLTETTMSDLEKEAWNRYLTQQTGEFEARLARAQLQNAIAAAQAEAEYRNRLLATQLAQQEFERQMAEKQFALNQALQNWQMRRTIPTAPTVSIPTPYGTLATSNIRDVINYMQTQREADIINSILNSLTRQGVYTNRGYGASAKW